MNKKRLLIFASLIVLGAFIVVMVWMLIERLNRNQLISPILPTASSTPLIGTNNMLGVEMLTSAQGPVDLMVTDPDGFTITPTTIIPSATEYLREIPGVLYYSEMEKGIDGNPIDQVYSYTAKTGDYIIKVLPDPTASLASIFWLNFSIGKQLFTLASGTPISKIPPQGYNVRVNKDNSIITTSDYTQANNDLEVKTYRNTEFGFEFEYPQNWKLEENSFHSPFSKFNLEGNSSAKYYNPEKPAFLANIVTPDFADRAIISFKNLNASTSIVTIASTKGVKYEYEFEGATQIGIVLSFGEYRMIFGTEKKYESIFNQILASFKFLK